MPVALAPDLHPPLGARLVDVPRAVRARDVELEHPPRQLLQHAPRLGPSGEPEGLPHETLFAVIGDDIARLRGRQAGVSLE